MYRFKTADENDIRSILEKYGMEGFNLSLDQKPRFFVLYSDQKLISYALVAEYEGYFQIEKSDLDQLRQEELELFVKSLLFLMDPFQKPIYANTSLGFFTYDEKGLYRLFCKKECGQV